MYESVQYGRVLHYIATLPYCTLSYILSLLLHTVHYLTFCLYTSILYTFLHFISTLPYCTLSYIISLLFYAVQYLAFCLYSSILYTNLHSTPTPPYFTLSYILSLLFHTVHYRTMYDNGVLYGRVGIKCMIVYSIEDYR
jgi:hypothetical protein